MGDFSHLSQTGEAKIVDVAGKAPTQRVAEVRGRVTVSADCAARLDEASRTEICRVARIAGIQAAKQTHALIPLCHQVPLQSVDVDVAFLAAEGVFAIEATAKAFWTTGVEMEGMIAASVAGATVYDMIKAVDPAASVGPFALARKLGGKGGTWTPSRDASR